jgi:hypothetical protein
MASTKAAAVAGNSKAIGFGSTTVTPSNTTPGPSCLPVTGWSLPASAWAAGTSMGQRSSGSSQPITSARPGSTWRSTATPGHGLPAGRGASGCTTKQPASREA